MAGVFFLLGGNRGDTQQIFREAVKKLAEEVGVVKLTSSLYQSPPWGFEDSQWFLNQVVFVETKLSPLQVLNITQQIEKTMGRKKKTTTHYEGRLLDIDILFYEDKIIETKQLVVPHPRLHLRRFTLVPLYELAPDLIHPVLKKSIRMLLSECPDQGEVTRVAAH